MTLETLPVASFHRHPMFPDAPFDLVLVAASAGGISAIRELLYVLPADFPTPIVICQHVGPWPSQLDHVLHMRSRIPVKFAENGERLHAGQVYVAPSGVHVAVSAQGRIVLLDAPRHNYVRPSADVLFESASSIFGPRLLAVVLTGMGRDAALGAAAVKRHGGIVIVQDPKCAEASPMPMATLRSGSADLVLGLEGIPYAIASLGMIPSAREWLGLPRSGPPLYHVAV